MGVIYTIGHSNFEIEKLIVWLHAYKINTIIDVRTRPHSRYCPHFNKDTLSKHLERFGVAYEFRGNNLGGLGENVNYDETIKELAKRCVTERIALMCSEKDYLKCHRHLTLEPDICSLGIDVKHIDYESVREHATD
jgi:uncharacterized protein (DUF488 family)